MAKMKDGLKAILHDVQHKKYTKELLSQKVDYDSWIRGQEAPLLLCRHFSGKDNSCLKIETKTLSYETEWKKNDGKISKNIVSCRTHLVNGKKNDDRNNTSVMELLEIPLDSWGKILPGIESGEIKEQLILVLINEGCLSELAIPMICEAFAQNAQAAVVYGDEDVLNGNKREQPWLKPDWSPDTFLSGFYFGSLVALSTEKLQKCLREKKITAEMTIYEALEVFIRQNGGFDTWKKANQAVVHIRQVLIHTEKGGYEQIRDWKPERKARIPELIRPEDVRKKPMISVIIPSKDHPDILFRCLTSFLEKTTADINVDNSFKYEFIIVDNGSNDENQKRIREKVQMINDTDVYKEKGFDNCRYLYEPMTFNFSFMCNRGAQEACGSYLLFLNDDMEILQPDWLAKLLEKAQLPYVGAVGAKLLYPQTDIIQHAGITNLRVGPAHKLQMEHDERDHYYGKNRGVHDVLGVTGACLLVSKNIFLESGGFDTELAVAFNDVDLCYKIYEAGYYNVVRNDVILYHHESLSRGHDGESAEKQQRLLKEKDFLYRKHQKIYGKDPFYHPYLTTDMLETEYVPAYRYQVDLSMENGRVRECTAEVAAARRDDCLVIGMECAMDLFKWKYGVTKEWYKEEHSGEVPDTNEEEGYYFQGYSFVIGSDNACYKKELLLCKCREDGTFGEGMPVYALSIKAAYRADIRDHLKDQLNVDLTGYATKLRKGAIPPGTYRFGMLAKDCCSFLKLVNWSSWTIEIQS